MDMIKKISLIVLASLISFGLSAEDISEEQARQIASGFWDESDPTAAHRAATALRLTYQPEGSEFYVFNRPGSQGWVIVAGDDTAPGSILAYSDTGSFDYDMAPEAAKVLLGRYAEGIRQTRARGITRSAAAPAVIRRAAVTDEVEPLLKTRWNQNMPYNNLCPDAANGGMAGYGGHCPSGCVPTAIAQIMNYWQWPKHGYGSHTNLRTNSQTVDFNQSVYDWDNMLDSYTEGNYNEAQAQAVARLMADIGCALNTDYADRESGTTNIHKWYMPLFRYFNYNPDVITEWWSDAGKDGVSWSDWMKAELRARRPVLCSGYVREVEAHSFVCDGFTYYEDGTYIGEQKRFNLFHINFGWGGDADGYYADFDTELTYSTLNHWNNEYIGFRPSDIPRTHQGNNQYMIRNAHAELIGFQQEGSLANPLKVEMDDAVEYNGKSFPVTTIYPELFHNVPVGTVTFPKTMKRIPSHLFCNFEYVRDCPLYEITLPEGVEEICDSAFFDCYNLSSSITFPSTLRRIGKGAFEGTRLGVIYFKGKNFTIDDRGIATRNTYLVQHGLEYAARIGTNGVGALIGDLTLSPNCQYAEGAITGKFDRIIVPKKLKYFNSNMFGIGSGTAEYVVHKGNSNYVSVNSMLLTKDLKTLVAFPCYEISDRQLINRDLAYIPAGITKIERNAIGYGPGLIHIPGTVKEMDGAFTNCGSIHHLYIFASTPPVINDESTFSSSVNEYGSSCKLYVPHGSKAAYQQANAWKNFNTIIDDELYLQGQYCYEVSGSNDSWNSQWTSIAKRNTEVAFDGHANIPGTITLDGKQRTVADIQLAAFWGDTQLKTVTIPMELDYCSNSFIGCTNLYAIKVASGSTTMHSTDGMLFHSKTEYRGNRLIACPPMQQTSTGIVERSQVVVPTETEEIGNGTPVFSSNMTRITIPAGVTRISYNAFKYATNLKTIICQGTTPPAYTEEGSLFSNSVRQTATVYVPKGCTEAYKQFLSYGAFRDFWNIVEYDPANPNIPTEDPADPEEPEDPDEPDDPGVDGTVTSLILLLKDGTTQTFELATQPVITVAGTELKILANNADVSIPLTDVVRYTFQKRSTTGIDEADSNREAIDYNDGVLTLSGLKAGTAVRLFAIDGKLIQTHTVLHDGTYRHSLSTLQKGVYIVKANHTSYKILKR